MESFLAHCNVFLPSHSGVLLAFFVGGLTGSLTHCLTMCGPLVAGQAACAKGCGAVRTGVGAGYHLGRLTSYGALGFVAALFGKQIAALPYWPTLSAVMLVFAGLMFVASSISNHAVSTCGSTSRSSYLRGVLMGFMPCGLIYAALMMAATLGNPLLGMAAMMLFVLGTVPALVLASSGVAVLRVRWQPAINRIGRVAMACNGIFLVATAVRTVGMM